MDPLGFAVYGRGLAASFIAALGLQGSGFMVFDDSKDRNVGILFTADFGG